MTDEMIEKEKLDALAADVSRLPRSIEPPGDAWTGIRAAIQEGTKPSSTADVFAPQFWQRPAFLIAASLLLIAGSSVLTARVLHKAVQPSVTTVGATSAPAIFVQFTAKERDYIQTASRLSALLDSQQNTLTPETVAKLRESIAVIDAAILEAREALASDPANKEIMEMLSSSYYKKLDLLRRSAVLARS